MKKLVEIENCVECPHLSDSLRRMPRCLAQKYLIIEDVYQFPSWCPLPDQYTNKTNELDTCNESICQNCGYSHPNINCTDY